MGGLARRSQPHLSASAHQRRAIAITIAKLAEEGRLKAQTAAHAACKETAWVVR